MLGLLRECAHAPAPRPQENLAIDYYYNMALKKLTSSVWTKHEQVRSWLNNYWLNISEVSLHSDLMLFGLPWFPRYLMKLIPIFFGG